MKALQKAARLYQTLVRLYPDAFYQDYGAAMTDTFDCWQRDAYQQTGWRGVWRVWELAALDLLSNVPAAHLEQWQFTKTGGLPMLRRSIDILTAILGVWLTFPLLTLAALLMRLESPGSILYYDSRIGQHGRVFTMYKLRTMTATTPPHLTRIGRVVRWSRLDEAPQFVNLLRGEMSLFGPRPASAAQAEVALSNSKPGLLQWG